jgi:hypothetical protein
LPYDLSPADSTTFLADVDNRVVKHGLDAILSIPEGIEAEELDLRTITQDYGRIMLDQVRAHVDTYINLERRDFQNSFIYNCLWNSLTASAKKKVNLNCSKFTIHGNGIHLLLLKLIIQPAYVDMHSTTMHFAIVCLLWIGTCKTLRLISMPSMIMCK